MKPSDQSASAPDAPPFMAPGFLTRRTAELDRVIDDAIDRGRIVGTVVIAAHKGETVYQRAAGYADRESHRPALTGEIFRLASMTKAIVSAAVLALADQGKLSIDDPVTRWLPSFRPTLADGAARREPGTRWHYSVAVDVLGAVLERVTGSSLPEAVRALVTAPLGLASLRFVVPKDASIATPYGDSDPRPTAMTPVFELPFFGSAIRYSPARIFDAEAFSSGGTGMVGTAADYLRFIEAIRSGGAGVLH